MLEDDELECLTTSTPQQQSLEEEQSDAIPTLHDQAKELKRLSTDLSDFKEVYSKRLKQDTYRFAEIAEAEDFKINMANANRVMIVGENAPVLFMIVFIKIYVEHSFRIEA